MGLDDATRKSIFMSALIAIALAFGIVGGSFLGTILFFPKEELLPGAPESGPIYYTIEESIETRFSSYEPLSIDVNPQLRRYEFDLSKAINRDQFDFGLSERSLLEKNGFVVVPAEFGQFYDLYEDNYNQSIPSFVTTDSILHSFHILYDYLLRKAETSNFTSDLAALIDLMLDWHSALASSLDDGSSRVEDAIRKNVAFFSVAKKLLDPDAIILTDIQELVNAELALIESHQSLADSPIFGPGYLEDYSQYIPRGHYDRSSILQQYFKAMMWLSRFNFRLEPGKSDEGRARGHNETRQAILISLALEESQNGSTTALALWKRIYEPTVFFVGAADDLTVYDYLEILNQTMREIESPELLENDSTIQLFINEAMKQQNPLISSSFVLASQNHSNASKGFRFMGQRFLPDSYIFQELVYDNVNDRMLPKGLDIFSVFRSARAEEHLQDQEDYKYYTEQIQNLRNEFSKLSDSDWAQNLYWLWLYSLLPLLNQKGLEYPSFMQNEAWSDKELLTSLGSWTELRHDTILYAKQNYTSFGETPSLATRGFVEPNPHLFSRLLSLAQMLEQGMSERGLLSSTTNLKLNLLIDTLQNLTEISKKELKGQKLTDEDISYIRDIHKTLRSIVSFPNGTEYISNTDKKISLVADVHTDPNTDQVLEEGVGDVFAIYVLIRDPDGKLFVARGGMFSYYEFAWPINDRLTDESWQSMLDAGRNPPPPSWTESFLLLDVFIHLEN